MRLIRVAHDMPQSLLDDGAEESTDIRLGDPQCVGDRCEEIDLVWLGIFEVSPLDRFFPEYHTPGVVTEVFQGDIVPGWLGQEG